MQAFREIVRGWLGKVLLALLTVPLVLVGIESYFSGKSSEVLVAKVDGAKIPQSMLDKAVESQRQQLQARMGPDATLTSEQKAQLRERVLNSLVQRQLLLASAAKAGYRVSEASIDQLIQSTPAFQDNGKFSQARYIQVLSSIGETPNSFPQRARDEIIVQQRVSGVLQSAFVTPNELDQLAALDAQQRDVRYAVVPADRFLPSVSVSDAEVKAYYDKQGQRFLQPERVRIDYLTLSRTSFQDKVKVTPEAVQALYDERVKSLSASEERHAAHILIVVNDKTTDAKAKAKIDDLAKQLAAGADFATLAKANSQDPGSATQGGDLGYAGRGMFVPEFEQALFALAKPGDVSAVIKSPFGYHLIKLIDVRKPTVPDLATLRPQLEAAARQTQADELYSQASEKLDASVYESSDLQEPAKASQLTVSSTGFFDRKGGEGIAADRKVVDAAFSDELTKDHKNSTAIGLHDGSTVWLHVAEYQPARKLPLTEVATVIQGKLRLDKAQALAFAEASKVVAAGAITPLADAAKASGLNLLDQTGLTRRSTQLAPELLRDVFRAPYPVNGKPQLSAFKLSNGAAVLAVTAVKPGAAMAAAERTSMQNMLAENRGQQELQDVLAYLKKKADVEIIPVKSTADQE